MTDLYCMHEDILQQIADLDARKEALRQQVLTYVRNTTFPLEERWKVFVDSKLGTEHDSIKHWDVLNEFNNGSRYRCSLEEHFIHNGEYVQKHETIRVTDIIERLYDEIEEMEEECHWRRAQFKDFLNKDDEPFSEKDIVRFKEEVLRRGIWSYRFDW